MSKNLLIFLNFLLGIVVLFEIGGIALTLKNSDNKNYQKTTLNSSNRATTSTQKEEVAMLTASSIYPETDWVEETDKNTPGSLTSQHSGDILYNVNIDKKISTSGKEWVSTRNSYQDFEKKSAAFLGKQGWSNNINFEEHQLSSIFADGPAGSEWSYLRENDGNIEVIILSYLSVSKNTEKVSLECPCDYKLRVFISNPIPVAKIQEAIRK